MILCAATPIEAKSSGLREVVLQEPPGRNIVGMPMSPLSCYMKAARRLSGPGSTVINGTDEKGLNFEWSVAMWEINVYAGTNCVRIRGFCQLDSDYFPFSVLPICL
ncbi:unnamed protein product [Schistocephalus solidus]|uniref:SCP domain-containing protein n=1 Tax=Schistocephalus solidus TaxID=70667 RepID=A0A183TM84_SCHSO|nr:unnamed protein product [Schistocephalus solidus]